MALEDSFKKCSTCKEPIRFEQKYWSCSVSTCNRPRLALYFCSLPCWEAHVPEARHRDAWAEEQKAPSRATYQAEQAPAESPQPTAKVVDSTRQARIVGQSTVNVEAESGNDDDVLVVVSKIKKYIRDRSGMNTSDTAIGPLSDHLRAVCRQAIRHATEDGRKTVMDRDFAPFLEPKR